MYCLSHYSIWTIDHTNQVIVLLCYWEIESDKCVCFTLVGYFFLGTKYMQCNILDFELSFNQLSHANFHSSFC